MVGRGCCRKECVLRHFVSINYPGNTVLVFGGICLLTYPGVDTWMRVVGGANAIGMLLAQLFYTAYWNTWGGIAAFSKNKDDAHPLTDLCRLESWMWTLAASMYYVLFAAAFLTLALPQVEDNPALAQSYVIAAGLWHAWCALVLWCSTATQCGVCQPDDDGGVCKETLLSS
jgi:hypothetical protein